MGSIIHTLANKQSLKRDQDVDIVCAMQDGELFEADGFKKCLFIPALYTAKMDNMSVDSYVTSGAGKYFVLHNALTRDFTIGCLYCDENGVILDPTGEGLEDLNKQILRTVIPPALCFQEDPERLLRAIKRMCADFRPTPGVFGTEWELVHEYRQFVNKKIGFLLRF